MTGKGLTVLAGAAVALGLAAYFMGGDGKGRSPAMTGERLVGDFDVEKVASIEIGDKIKLVSGEGGWTIATMQDYPADRAKIAENLIKLMDLKVGQVVTGKTLSEKTPVVVRDAAGKELAAVTLGERHEKWGFGRYAEYKGKAVLTGESLDAFGDDPKRWCETKIVDEPWISFSKLAGPDVDEAALGFTTGVVAKITIAGDTNRVATIGAAVAGGSDRYLKLDGQKWVYIVPSYSVEKLLPKPEDGQAESGEPGEKPAAEPGEKPAAEPAPEPVAEPAPEPAAGPAPEPATAEESAS